MTTFIPRASLLELKKLARAFFGLKPSSLRPEVEFHSSGSDTQVVIRRNALAIALSVPARLPLRSMHLPFSVLEIGAPRGEVAVRDIHGGVELSWTDQDVPQRMAFVAPSCPEPMVVPELNAVDGRFITALARASAITDARSKRYALQCVQLDGSSGTITATDGRQLLQYQGFRFPWPGEALLFPGNRAFAAPELRRQREIACAREGEQLAELALAADTSAVAHSQSGVVQPHPSGARPAEPPPRPATPAQVQAINAIAARMGIGLTGQLQPFGVSSPAELTLAQASRLIDQLKQSRAPASA